MRNNPSNKLAFLSARLQDAYYIQSFSARPLFLNASAISGFTMRSTLGYSYRHFLMNYNQDYSEGCYLSQDFDRLWGIIKKKLSADQNYLEKVNRQYWQTLKQYNYYYNLINRGKLAAWPEDRLLEAFRALTQAQIDVMGISHIIEVISLKIEEDFRSQLSKELVGHDQANFNYLFQTLIAPTQASFVAQEEKAWRRLLTKKVNRLTRKKLLTKHLKRYFWLQNSYAGPQPLTIVDLEQRYQRSRKEKSVPDLEAKVTKQKNKLLAEYNFSLALKKTIEIIDYTATWQDKRKAVIFKNIGYLGLVCAELTRRLRLKPEVIYYLGCQEALALKSLSDLKKLVPELTKRLPGVLFYQDQTKEIFISGTDYKKLNPKKILLKSFGPKQKGRDLKGTVANNGPAVVGPVKILRGLSDINKVKPGDILVASMTRPEFMSAIRLAAAIVTDEGGITCHAAIIARELNIPAIIGTKIATKLLQDGCLVEVKANHGLVRILK